MMYRPNRDKSKQSWMLIELNDFEYVLVAGSACYSIKN